MATLYLLSKLSFFVRLNSTLFRLLHIHSFFFEKHKNEFQRSCFKLFLHYNTPVSMSDREFINIC